MSEKNRTNSNSVISLTVGILSLLIPFIGLILGIVGIAFSRKAVKQIEKTNENGRGLATLGLICSIVGLVIQIFMFLGLIPFFLLSTASTSFGFYRFLQMLSNRALF
ncbi:DUF4190 domain-containing protein [Cytobacillus depressus]|uniref:DUF4190 domain-containing protein n=1 Tax=Cytobacillus depressus TaxID=1602942 RepID=A0A6L3UWT8_9BACI|nr:DUF4190 domain-containing protein [Cytobacillus depressus]KAB2328343.1 DUF4190 domain-containing protein [Cytobacillus depressus]